MMEHFWQRHQLREHWSEFLIQRQVRNSVSFAEAAHPRRYATLHSTWRTSISLAPRTKAPCTFSKSRTFCHQIANRTTLGTSAACLAPWQVWSPTQAASGALPSSVSTRIKLENPNSKASFIRTICTLYRSADGI